MSTNGQTSRPGQDAPSTVDSSNVDSATNRTAGRDGQLSEAARAYVRELVAQAPPLTAEQRDRLRLLFAPARKPDTAA